MHDEFHGIASSSLQKKISMGVYSFHIHTGIDHFLWQQLHTRFNHVCVIIHSRNDKIVQSSFFVRKDMGIRRNSVFLSFLFFSKSRESSHIQRIMHIYLFLMIFHFSFRKFFPYVVRYKAVSDRRKIVYQKIVQKGTVT